MKILKSNLFKLKEKLVYKAFWTFNSKINFLNGMTLQFNVMNSLWPLLIRIIIFNLIIRFIFYLRFLNIYYFLIRIIILIIIIFIWFKDLRRESKYLGSGNFFIQICIKFGILIFIFSEIIFFLSFFWSYLHFITIIVGETGFIWPPINIVKIDFKTLSFINTIILLRRGFSLTRAHLFLIQKNDKFKLIIIITCILGIIFLYFQYIEYLILEFLWSDSIFGSIFYLTTGFHGFHVFVGLIFLLTILIKNSLKILTIFDIAAWYWHFVDVVWLLLFILYYWIPAII